MSQENSRFASTLNVNGTTYAYYPVSAVAGSEQLPYSLTVLLENVLRNAETPEAAEELAARIVEAGRAGVVGSEIEFSPARVLFQDFTGVPVFVDFAVMREACAQLGGDPTKINPQIPCDLVIDHSVIADVAGCAGALAQNMELEFSRNKERYDFLKWSQESGQPTYFMALKDDAGLVKQFAMLDIQRYQNVAVGNTVAECQKAYQALLATNGVLTEEGVDTGSLEMQGTISTIAQAVMEGNSHFYVTLDEGECIYDFALPGLIEIVGYKEGDTISFTYVEAEPTNPVEEILDSSKAGTSEKAAEQTAKEADATADAKGDAA